MSHVPGCPCNGWGGAYARCECDEINTRNHTAALDRHTEALRMSDNGKDDEIARLTAALAAANERVRELEDAIAWALGEADDFPPRGDGEGAYWWRTELRKRAAARAGRGNDGSP